MKYLILNDNQLAMVNSLVNVNLQCNLKQADYENGAKKTNCLTRAKISDEILDAIQLAEEI